MADDRTFLEEAQSKARGYLGRELSPNEMATEFAKWSIDTRVATLERIERDMRSGPLTINEAAKQHGHVQALRSMHEKLRRVNR